MKQKIYLLSDFLNHSFLIELLSSFEVVNLSTNKNELSDIQNKNIIIFFSKKKLEQSLDKSFIKKNNILFFTTKDVSFNYPKNKPEEISFPLRVNKFIDIVKNYFYENIFVFKDIKIYAEEITNTNNNVSCHLTLLEKKILLEIIDKKTITKDYFLENILQLNKNTETKTIESHLTRIRKKLLEINSFIQIQSRGNKIFIGN